MRKSYEFMMGKFINLNDKRLQRIIDLIGKDSSLTEGLQLAKALINNYFEEDENAEAILKLIDALQKKRLKNDN